MAYIGIIADDFTGASDAASFLVKGGLRTKLYNGTASLSDSGAEDAEVQAVVIALKSRTQETSAAVRDSLEAARALLARGVRKIYFKYCSTFDSTPEGNIGPVADALMECTGSPYSILCPALPVNGRVQRGGKLYVNGVPLDESPMKDHPLTPMRDSDLTRLMAPQSRYPSYAVPVEETAAFLEAHAGERFYLVPDYTDAADGEHIAETFADLPLLTGGSGLLEPLARIWAQKLEEAGRIPASAAPGEALLLAGSCSAATLSQIAHWEKAGNPSYKLDPMRVLSGEETPEHVMAFVRGMREQGRAALVYSSDRPEKVRAYQEAGAQKVSAALESFTAALARAAVQEGFTRIISAGGETSGAVTQALGFSSYLIGESVAPGVPVMVPAGRPEIRLILKSGNFGQEDFFTRACRMTYSQEVQDAVWAAHSLFERGKTSGSSANMSFRVGDTVYISASGTCFGTLQPEDFVPIRLDGTPLAGRKPSKEWPLHTALYAKDPSVGAVIHTHSTYSVLWSFLPVPDETDCIPQHTPYLRMKLGKVGEVPYEKPGSEALFAAFRSRVAGSDGFLLKQHGPVVPGKSVMEAFYNIEELEESARVAWELHRAGIR